MRSAPGKNELAGVDASLRLGHAAVVDFDLVGVAGEDDARRDSCLAGDAQPLSLSGGPSADGYRNFCFGVAIVAYDDGDQPPVGKAGAAHKLAGGDAFDAEVGEAAVAIDPVVEEPVQILVRELFQRMLHAGGVVVELRGEAVGLERLLQRVIAEDGAEHPPDCGGLGAVEDVAGCGGQAQGVRAGEAVEDIGIRSGDDIRNRVDCILHCRGAAARCSDLEGCC